MSKRMALCKIENYYPDYKNRFFDGDDIKGAAVYARGEDGEEKVGSVYTMLVDTEGRIRYLVVDIGFWIFGKKVLLPIGRSVDDPERDRIYTTGLTKEQVENLPEYTDDIVIDYDYEERVRSVYRMQSLEQSASVERSVPVEQGGIKGHAVAQPKAVPEPVAPPAKGAAAKDLPTADMSTAESDTYEREPELYEISDENHRRLRLYEERLVADKHREKTGSVTVTKRIETEAGEASVPIQKEKVVIEIESVVGATRVNTPEGSFQDGEVTHMDVYEERANIHKDAVVHQEINIRKEVEEDVVTARETLRREELDVQQTGEPDVTDRT